MTIPNRITLARIAFTPFFIYFLLSSQSLFSHKLIAAALFLLLALSDTLDGYLARKMGQSSAFGALMDPLADKLLVYCAFIVFVETGTLWAIFALLIIARDFLVMGVRVWAAKSGRIIAASELGKWKTASQMVTIVFMILDLPFWKILFSISLLLCLYSGWEYYKQVDTGEI
ncbi:MAG: CDP-diacylglycerol--glycerol-3-phosphate 3-phosphatidyltransferase [Candidatus Margulisiibacteriota bacterium]